MVAGAWFLLACVAAALICSATGALAVLRAALAVKRHAKAIAPDALIVKLYAAQDAAERLQRSLTLAETLVPRAAAALHTIAASLRFLRFVFRVVR